MKLTEVAYTLLLVACLAGSSTSISFGTSVSSPTTYKYQAAVLCPTIMCSGAIVSSRNVLTTATCINNLSPTVVQVYVGSVRYYSDGYPFNVANILKHPSFNPTTYDYNIEILTVDTAFDFTIGTVQRIPLATSLSMNTYSTATAYGAIDTSLTLPDTLQSVSLISFSVSNCNQYKNKVLAASMFCAGDPAGKKDLCPGDQGAPLVYQSKLVGLYSWGCSCGLAAPNPSSPVFTSIPYLRNWIQTNIITP